VDGVGQQPDSVIFGTWGWWTGPAFFWPAHTIFHRRSSLGTCLGKQRRLCSSVCASLCSLGRTESEIHYR
jgi:hypothetical protein